MIKYQPKINPDIPSLEYQKAEILANFNFNLMALVMSSACRAYYDNDCKETGAYTTWKTFNANTRTLEQPTAESLKKDADGLLSDVIANYRTGKSDYCYIGCGGFKATCRYGILELEFIVESWSWDQ